MELPSEIADRPFTVAEARALGIPRSALRRESLSTCLRGVRALPQVPDTLAAACVAALLLVPPGALVSHATALRLHDVDLPRRLDDDNRIHVTVGSRSTVSARPELRVHRAAAQPPSTVRHGIPTATAMAAWIQVAARASIDDLVVVADGLMRRGRALATPETLCGGVDQLRPGTRGIRRLRLAVALARPGTESVMETLTRLVLVHAGLPCPVVNTEVRDGRGRFLARPDLHYPDLKIAIEYDGDVHRTDPSTWRRDVERRQRLEEAGWLIVTATADDVLRQPERLVARVRRARRRRAA